MKKTIKRIDWNKMPDDYKGFVGKIPYILQLDEKTGATVSTPIKII